MDLRLGIPPRVRTAMASLLLPLHLAACTVWRVQPESPRDVLARAPEQVRLTLPGGSTYIVYQAHVAADSLVGVNEPGTRVAVPLAQIQQIEVRQASEQKTMLVIVGIVVVGAVAVFAIVGSAMGGPSS